jgi:hypothetical protein
MAGLIPPGLKVPPGMDPTEFYLQLPAMGPDQVPPGADTTMTTNGPDQVWFLVVAVTCTAIPALFLAMRLYTRLAIVRSLEMADCMCEASVKIASADESQISCFALSYVSRYNMETPQLIEE